MSLICRINNNITLIQFYTLSLENLGSVRFLMFLKSFLLLSSLYLFDQKWKQNKYFVKYYCNLK